MKVQLNLLRMDPKMRVSYWQSIICDGLNENDTVATALRRINDTKGILDTKGKPVSKIIWESSCLQKKCGACAMRIDGVPRLACSVSLGEKKGEITLEPLKKFPVIADLLVNRSILFDTLSEMKVWLEEEAETEEKEQDIIFESARCLQCGCCLEICPNFYTGGTFAGMAAMTPMTRILSVSSEDQVDVRKKEYRKRIYEGCGKSLACRNICPAGIEIDALLVRSNAIAVWNRRRRNR